MLLDRSRTRRERDFLLVVAIVAFFVFFIILILVELGLTDKIDKSLTSYFPTLWGGPFDFVMLASTFLGNYVPLTLTSLILCYILAIRRHVVLASGLVLVLIEAGALVLFFKTAVSRLRPVESFYISSGFAFPSGHATLASAIALALVVIIFDLGWPYMWKVLSAVSVVLVALAIIFSRLYLNVHWVSDVAGGVFLGIFSAGLIMAVLESRSQS